MRLCDKARAKPAAAKKPASAAKKPAPKKRKAAESSEDESSSDEESSEEEDSDDEEEDDSSSDDDEPIGALVKKAKAPAAKKRAPSAKKKNVDEPWKAWGGIRGGRIFVYFIFTPLRAPPSLHTRPSDLFTTVVKEGASTL